MPKTRLRTFTLLGAGIIASALVGCGGPDADTGVSSTTVPAARASLPADLFTTVSLGNPTALSTARGTAQPGEEITVIGVVGGRANPFTAERAVLVLADESLEFCGEECRTPWDACCVPPEEIAAKTATVQVVDESGGLLRVGLEGQSDLAASSRVTIHGTVAQSDGGAFVINAKQIHVVGAAAGVNG